MTERGHTIAAVLITFAITGLAVVGAAMEVDGDPLTEFLFDAVIFVGVWWVIALFVRWAWYRGVPRLRAGVRGWRENGR